MGIKKEIAEKGGMMELSKEGFVVGRVKIGKEKWRVIGVYVGEGIEKACREMEKWTEEKEEEVYTIIGGDFNARTGQEGGRIRDKENAEEERKEEKKRKSKDKLINAEGRKLLEFMGERGWSIMNGNTKGDEEGEWTFTGGRGNTVIDYVIGNEDSGEKVRRLRIRDKVDSDHHPIEVEIEGWQRRERRKSRGGRRGVWNEEGRRIFEGKVEEIGEIGGGEEEIDGEWERIEERMKEVLRATEEDWRKGKKEKRGWWDGECREEKRKVRRELRRWWREGERLRKDVEEKGIVPENQMGFRRGMGTIDNIYVMNYLINRQLEKKEGRLTALFIDLRAAFDSVDREKLMEAMEERGVRKGLRRRVEMVMRETTCRIKIGEEVGESFGLRKE
ncbi:cilia- and flagella-associated protein 251-like [Nylanderia fulva]|uniref:cilia- and flagella-associated protein 251-like n=1 Tax=Nylanderia fulva TaxID=613905 RepID=UPI0010FBBE48|nr:cilia- and flagella-associated protein 251-like [Nylanderia fulva]